MNNPDFQYYSEAELDSERKEGLECPHKNVPENLLPAIKASFLCYSQSNREELMYLLAKRTVQESARSEPSIESFLEAIKKIADLAKSNQDKNFLYILVFATHGYSKDGFQEVLSPFYDAETNLN